MRRTKMSLNRFVVSRFCLFIFAIIFAISDIIVHVNGQSGNRPPEFLPGGDMSNFAISEDATVGSNVYTLKGRDPDGSRVHYYISGDTFSVDKDTGVVRLIRKLDREKETLLDVVITIVDEKLNGRPQNTISLPREIRVVDTNDNAPVFVGAPYRITVNEATKAFSQIHEFLVTDADGGRNSDVRVECGSKSLCEMFTMRTQQIGEGQFKSFLYLQATPLDYEAQSEYRLKLVARDSGGLESSTVIDIQVVDVQDEPPRFMNAPYSIAVDENTSEGTSVLIIEVRDGDLTPETQRPIQLDIVQDPKRWFEVVEKEPTIWMLQTSDIPINREDPEISLNGGLYQLRLKATEIIRERTGESFGESSYANVSIIVNDVNDQRPTFNMNSVTISVPEDIVNGSAIPGLHLIASDSDIGDNAKFNLLIQDLPDENSIPPTEIFSLYPSVAVGRTPVIIKVKNAELLDYEMEDRRQFVFNVVATQGDLRAAAKVTINIVDANDHEPVFENDQYFLQIPENVPPNVPLFSLEAYDADSGDFGQVTYTLKGLGADKFSVDSETGQIFVTDCGEPECLDFETQPSYSLTYEAKDGGGKYSSANLFIELIDVNDNEPMFKKNLYVRELFERDSIINPPLILKATDADGPTQGGGGNVRYFIKSSNLTGLEIDAVSGELRLKSPIPVVGESVEKNQRRKVHYEAIVTAVDGGKPPRSSDVKVVFLVKSERDGAPIFINEPYEASVKENAVPGTAIIQLRATDPDGPDAALRYSILDGSKDNFIIDPVTGHLKVSGYADLDRDLYGSTYKLVVGVMDAGTPVPLSSSTTVQINVEDINNKPPKFETDTYVKYIPENQVKIGEEVIRVKAIDPDLDAKIRYSIVSQKMKARDKTGLEVDPTRFKLDSAFLIDATSGAIKLSQKIDSTKASVISFPVMATDLNAINGSETQRDVAEVTVYIQTHSDKNPVFAAPWTQSNPMYEIGISEERFIGSTVMTLSARDPKTGQQITKFEKITSSDPDNYVSVSPLSGIVTLNRRLDYEDLHSKQIKFSVKAIGSNEGSSSIANVILNVEDVNDNSPIFSQDAYFTSVLESGRWPLSILTVQATDKDSGSFGEITYSLSGDGSHLFTIDPQSGTISIAQNATLDREIKELYNVQVTAADGSGRMTSVIVTIKLNDVNDNAPKFKEEKYTAVVPENVPVGFMVGTITATDPDEGANGQVKYYFVESQESPAERFFKLHPETGVLTVASSLSGKGRMDPYDVYIKAVDGGDPSMQSETLYSVLIGDVSSNDGVPKFIKPAPEEVIYVTENIKPNTFVYQVYAVDADSPSSPNGKVMYRFLEESAHFSIDPITGIIVTSNRRDFELDRERTENFTLLLVAFDLGVPSQEAHTILKVKVLDVDDNKPIFERQINSPPIIMKVDEELPPGSRIGSIAAVDRDAGINSLIIYEIIDGNQENVFSIESANTTDNSAYLIANRRLDREERDEYKIAIKARPANQPHDPNYLFHSRPYNSFDLSEIEVIIRLNDVNDNPPQFDRANYVTGVHLNTPLHSTILTFGAKDPDIQQANSRIDFFILDANYFSGDSVKNGVKDVFELNSQNGILKNVASLRPYVGGYFELLIVARTFVDPSTSKMPPVSDEYLQSETVAKVFVIHDKDLLKIVFNRKPSDVKNSLDSLQATLREKQPFPEAANLVANVFDIQYLERKDGSLDFEATAACFQLVTSPESGRSKTLTPKEALKLLRNESLPVLRDIWENYTVTAIETCMPLKGSYMASRSEMAIIGLMVALTFITLILICIASRLKRKLKRQLRSLGQPPQPGILAGPLPPGPPPHHPSRMSVPYGVPAPSFINISEQQRIYEWQESSNHLDAISCRSVPTVR